jgi:hypothetical protein
VGDSRDDEAIGYKRPPKASQWKKGQSGNPKGGRKHTMLNAVETIDRLFAKQIDIVEHGMKRRISVLEAILLRLWANEIAGDKRAAAVRLKYEEFVPKPTGPPKIILRDVDET